MGKRIAILGAGISGLAAAQRILRQNADNPSERRVQFTIFDPSSRVGGVISTRRDEGFLVEESSDNFITTMPWAVDLCDELGLKASLRGTDPAYRRTFVVCRGRLRPLPDGFLMMAPTRLWPMALTPILSPLGKIRAAMEYFLPRRVDSSDESVRAFATRRLGREVFERLIEPLVSGVYAADMERLSVAATLPQFREMEQKYRSLIRAMRVNMSNRRREERSWRRSGGASDTGARYSLFMTPREGLETIPLAIRALVEKSPDATLCLGTGVDRVAWDSAGTYRVFRTDGATEVFDGVIFAAPSHATASIVRDMDPLLSSELSQITHSGTAVLTVAFRADQVRTPAHGAGAVVPSIERLPILAISFSNHKYPFRSPQGTVLLRVFAGGVQNQALFEQDDASLQRTLLDALRPLLSITGDPIYATMARWPRTMPQYHIGHKDLIATIRERVSTYPGLAIAGNFLDGVGIPQCIHNGQLAAGSVAAHCRSIIPLPR